MLQNIPKTSIVGKLVRFMLKLKRPGRKRPSGAHAPRARRPERSEETPRAKPVQSNSIKDGNTLFPSLTHRYDRIADNWHATICKHGYLTAYANLIHIAHPSLSASTKSGPLMVLDAGTGSGGFSQALCETYQAPLSLDLLDLSGEMLNLAQANLSKYDHPIQTIRTSIDETDPKRKRYDLILCAHILEHCPDPIHTLKLLRSSFAPGGVLVLAVSKPHWCTFLVQLKWQNRAYRVKKTIAMLADAGFTDIISQGFTSAPPKFTSHGYIACAA